MKQQKRQKPKLSTYREQVSAEELDTYQDMLRSVEIDNGDLRFLGGLQLRTDDSIFTDCHFAEMDLTGISFVDTVFERCDFSNVNAGRADLLRCEFRNCKLTGANFDSSGVKHVLFEECDGVMGVLVSVG